MDKSSIVLELQKKALDKSIDVTDLLRKALLIATKLDLKDFRDWIKNELHGYKTDDVPEYRKIRSELKAENPYHGYVPFIITDDELMDKIENVPLLHPISGIVELIKKESEKAGVITLPFENWQTQTLLNLQPKIGRLKPVRVVSSNQLVNIIEAVRTAILEWSLKLESEGILGESISFSETEKEKATKSPEIRIENFQGILGDVSDSQVTQNLEMNITKGNFESLRNYLISLGIAQEDVNDLKNAIDSDPIPNKKGTFGEDVSSWFGKVIKKAASGILNIGIATASNLISNALCSYYGFG